MGFPKPWHGSYLFGDELTRYIIWLNIRILRCFNYTKT